MRTQIEVLKLDEKNLIERLNNTRQRIRRLALQQHVPVVAVPIVTSCTSHAIYHQHPVRIKHQTI